MKILILAFCLLWLETPVSSKNRTHTAKDGKGLKNSELNRKATLLQEKEKNTESSDHHRRPGSTYRRKSRHRGKSHLDHVEIRKEAADAELTTHQLRATKLTQAGDESDSNPSRKPTSRPSRPKGKSKRPVAEKLEHSSNKNETAPQLRTQRRKTKNKDHKRANARALPATTPAVPSVVDISGLKGTPTKTKAPEQVSSPESQGKAQNVVKDKGTPSANVTEVTTKAPVTIMGDEEKGGKIASLQEKNKGVIEPPTNATLGKEAPLPPSTDVSFNLEGIENKAGS